MSRRIVLRQPSVNRRQPLLYSQSSTASSARFVEVAGGTTAECAAICCCCPCGLVNLLVLAIYKVPAGLCRRVLRKRRRQRLIKNGLLPPRRGRSRCGCEETEFPIHPVEVADKFPETTKSEESEKAVMELEKEMWDRFYGTGFWRSPSQRLRENQPAVK